MDYLGWGLIGIGFVGALYLIKSVLMSEITDGLEKIVNKLEDVNYKLRHLDEIKQVIDQLDQTNRKLEDIEKMANQIKAVEHSLGGLVQTVDLYDLKSELRTVNVLLNSIENKIKN